ncbi:MAG TPA: FAD-dependent oxidoreductase [Polyangiaceae bacterium]|nr:FAD-dependent oxidoreductase [Polyangiaceae bacterium]
MERRRKVKLERAWLLSPSVRSLVLRTLDGGPIDYEAGQYIDVIVPTARGLAFRRSYSIASAPDAGRPGEIEIAVTRVPGGPTSEALHALSAGAFLEIEGPRGAFLRRAADRERPALFVAAGTGLAPIRAMLAKEVSAAHGAPLVLLFGCRTLDDVLWGEDLAAWGRSCARLAVHVTLSRPPPLWDGLAGYVQLHAVRLARSLPGCIAYVCGLTAMVDAVVATLGRDAGLPSDAIRFETYD